MIRKYFAILLVCLQVSGLAFANVLTVEEVSVVGAAADDYYTGSKTKLKVLDGNKIGKTLVTSAQVSSTTALSGLVAGAAGIAGIAYYERTGRDPVYAAANAVASAADAIFVPAYQAFKANFVSPESYPASAAQYVGVEGSVGATIGDLIDYVKDSSSGLYDNLKQLIADHTTSTTYDSFPENTAWSVGSIITTPSGNMRITGTWGWVGYYQNTTRFSSNYQSWFATENKYEVGLSYISYYSGKLYRWTPGYVTASGYGMLESIQTAATTDPATIPLNDTAILDFTGFKQEFEQANIDAATQEQLEQAIADMPADQKITSSNPEPSSVPSTSPSPITNNQIQNFFTDNTTNVYNKYLETVTNNVTNQGDVTNEVAQAAAETAKAQEDEATDDTYKTYSPPATWYTPDCDLSDGLSSCINYQQVLNASAAFQETALYQLPNLLLDCLGYVEGSGCEYPPKITVDFSSRFITDPMVLDMAPFDSVVKVMKFFFAILCIIGTGKAVMVLFS